MTIKPLTQFEVNQMHTGTRVYVIWSGGNKGEYRIKRDKYGNITAVMPQDNVFVAYLDHVGATKGHDKVFWMPLPDKETKKPGRVSIIFPESFNKFKKVGKK
jgi:hypothetical protein